MTNRVYLEAYLKSQVAVFGILAFSIIFIGTIVFVVHTLKRCYPGNATLRNCHCSLLEYNIHRLLQKLGIVKKGAGDRDKNPQSTLNGEVVSSFAAAMLFGYVLSMTVMILMVFIDKLILKISHTYEPGMTCYVASDNCIITSETFSTSQDSLQYNDTPVTCYKYQFDLVSALVAAGGLIQVAQIAIHLLILVLHRMARKCLPCYLCVLPIIIALGITVLIVIHVITCAPSAYIGTFFEINHNSLLKVKCIIFFTGIVSAAMAMVFLEPRTRDEDIDDETRPLLQHHNSPTDGVRTN